MNVSTDGSTKLLLKSFFSSALHLLPLAPARQQKATSGGVTCPQRGRDQHPLGKAPVTGHQAGQEHLARQGWLWGAQVATASSKLAASCRSGAEAPSWPPCGAGSEGVAARAGTLLAKATVTEAGGAGGGHG